MHLNALKLLTEVRIISVKYFDIVCPTQQQYGGNLTLLLDVCSLDYCSSHTALALLLAMVLRNSTQGVLLGLRATHNPVCRSLGRKDQSQNGKDLRTLRHLTSVAAVNQIVE